MTPNASARIYVGRLTPNVKKDHVHEIFSSFGKVISAELPMDRVHRHLHRGFAYVEFEKAEDAEKAMKYMDGGQIDGQDISVSKAEIQKPRARPPPPPVNRRRFGSPPRRRPYVCLVCFQCE